MSIFKACDIRGVVGDQWDETDAVKIGRSLGRLMRQRGEAAICVGGDFRRSTPGLKQALIVGLTQAGIDVCDVGLQATPVIYFAAKHLNCRNLAIVTASHNPGEYNGIKFQLVGEPPDPDLIRQLEQGIASPLPSVAPGTITSHDVIADYERWVVRHAQTLACVSGATGVSPVPLRTHRQDAQSHRDSKRNKVQGVGEEKHRLQVVIDSLGGAFTQAAPAILAAAGCAVTTLWEEPDRDFSGRSPNPSDDANLVPLIEAVLVHGADVGLALDGDGDRAVLVDHTGRIVRPEQLAVLIMQQYFGRPTVVYDLKCASIVARAAEAAGGTAVMRPSGYGFIKAEMIRRQAEMGVEASGHHFFGALGGGDDGLFTALVVLGILRQTGKSLANLIEPIDWPEITPDLRVAFQGDAIVTMDAIANLCGGRVSRLDGVRAEYEDGWALARPSITEPAVTFRFEGRSREDLPHIATRFLAAVPDLLELVMEKMDE